MVGAIVNANVKPTIAFQEANSRHNQLALSQLAAVYVLTVDVSNGGKLFYIVGSYRWNYIS